MRRLAPEPMIHAELGLKLRSFCAHSVGPSGNIHVRGDGERGQPWPAK